MTELLFFTVVNHRSLVDITPLNIYKQLSRNQELIEFFSWFKPETKRDEELVKSSIEEYHEVHRSINEFGLKGIVPKLKKAPILQAKKSESVEHIKKVYSCMPTREIVEENNRLIERLKSFAYRDREAIEMDLKKFDIVQFYLWKRRVPCDSLIIKPVNRSRVLYLLGEECAECGSRENLTIHHVKAKKDGGNDKIWNLKVLCRECHNKEHGVHNSTVARFREYKKYLKAEGVY